MGRSGRHNEYDRPMRWTAAGNTFLLIVRPTLELVLTAVPQAIVRERDATTGLDLIRP
jgi:predicted DNA-binding protein with PD1-like motif